jgi:hypothetical protein
MRRWETKSFLGDVKDLLSLGRLREKGHFLGGGLFVCISFL